MTLNEYLNEHGADRPYEPDYDEENATPEWLESWEDCLEEYAGDFCEAQERDPVDYIDGEKPFSSLEIGAIFLTDDGYCVKVTATSYSKHSDDIETLTEYQYQPAKRFDNLHEQVLATQFCV